MQVIFVFLLYALWSTSFAFGKMSLAFAPPVFLTAFRMIMAGCVLLGILLVSKRSSFKISFKQYLSLFLLGFFSIYLTNICEFWGLQHLSAAKTCFIYSLSPFFAVIFSYIHFKEKLNLKKVLGLVIGFLGFIPILMTQSGSEGLFSIYSFLTLPDLAVMGAALFSVYGWILLRLMVRDQNISPMMANGVSMMFGGMLALLHSYLIDPWNPVPVAEGHWSHLFLAVGAMTLISNIICFNLYGALLKRFTTTFLSFAGLLSPVFASLNGYLFLGEKPSLIIFGSTAIVCSGLYLVYAAELKQGYILNKPFSSQEVR